MEEQGMEQNILDGNEISASGGPNELLGTKSTMKREGMEQNIPNYNEIFACGDLKERIPCKKFIG